jgi:hypothetical protein
VNAKEIVMGWKIEPAAVNDIKRQKLPPNYGFIEQALVGGSGYLIVGDRGVGYFLVASLNSLAPGFVLEVSLPELAVKDRYEELASEMSQRSLGTLWFDSSDRDACDLVWRLGLAIRSGPPLFCSNGVKDDESIEGFEVRIAEKSEQARVMELFTSIPLDAGGQTKEAVIENLNGGCVAVLKKGGDVLGAAVLSPQPGPYVALSGVVMDTYSELPPKEHEKAHRALELLFMNSLASRIAKRNLKLVYSMARHTPQGYLVAISLKMGLVKQSFIASLTGGVPPVFNANLPEGARAVI